MKYDFPVPQHLHQQYQVTKKIASPESCFIIAANAQNAPPLYTSNYYNGIDYTGTVIGDSPDWYYQISSAIENLDGWLAATKPPTTVLLPFTDETVKPLTGWMYAENARHNAIDYIGTKGSFAVRAVADGKVIWVGYNPSPGNVVIIEHPGSGRPGSYGFRVIYHHLRNGRDNDIALARATLKCSALYNLGWDKPDKATMEENPVKYIQQYQADADQAAQILSWRPTDRAGQAKQAAQVAEIEARWGTNDQKISVKVGDRVKAGQQIGWAGRTGFDCASIHLHIMFARPATHVVGVNKQLLWTLFDPYGLYALPLSCYLSPNPSGKGKHQHPAYYHDDTLKIQKKP